MREEFCTEFTDPAGQRGYLVQAWDPDTATYEMIDALLTSARWIPSAVELVPGRGVPTFTYMTIRQMKQFGIAESAVRTLVVHDNYHLESILQLDHGVCRGADRDTGARHTRAYLSVETPMIQSSHRVQRCEVRGGRTGPIADVLAYHASGGSPLRREIARDRTDEHARLLTKFARSSTDPVYYGYELHLTLTPP